jgi:hypothetical protein
MAIRMAEEEETKEEVALVSAEGRVRMSAVNYWAMPLVQVLESMAVARRRISLEGG